MQIHEIYHVLAKRVVDMARKEMVDEPYILKTDCWNEAHYVYPIAPLFRNLVSVDAWKEKVTMARAIGHRVDLGRVESLPYTDDNFDVLLDLSTIDHVKEYWRVFDEYKRVLRAGGYALIVCWFNPEEIFDKQENEYLDQYYFNYQQFLSLFQERFKLLDARQVTNDIPLVGDEHRVLGYLIGKVKK